MSFTCWPAVACPARGLTRAIRSSRTGSAWCGARWSAWPICGAPDRGLPARGGRSYRLVTGALYGKLLAGPLLPRLEELLPGRVGVTVVENSLLGRSITVAGLLPGRDILRALAAEARAEVYLIPEAALNHEDRFIDDLQLEELRRSLAPSEVVVAPDLARAIRLIAGREAAGV